MSALDHLQTSKRTFVSASGTFSVGYTRLAPRPLGLAAG
jgi:hypothetical protein